MTSLDGYIEDEEGKFDWAAPSDEVHAAANDLARAAGTFLYGRRMCETMAVWETDPGLTSQPGVEADFARIWQTADKLRSASPPRLGALAAARELIGWRAAPSVATRGARAAVRRAGRPAPLRRR